MLNRKRQVFAAVVAVTFSFLFVVHHPLASAADGGDFGFYQSSGETHPYPLIKGLKARNVILCIGDGMGLGQVALARLSVAGPDGKLYMERMPVAGLMWTHAADNLVTDSAASATAMACGFKTNNGMVGMLPDEGSCETILEAARARQMATGLVATSGITHATPACFAAHVPSRNMQAKIAEQMLAARVNVIFGGGREYFLPKSSSDSIRNDERNLIAGAQDAGYSYIWTADQLRSVEADFVLGLFAAGALTTREPEPSLAELTEKAIEILSGQKKKVLGFFNEPKGFFLMVEGSQIDWACHDNDVNECVRQTLLFDEAVKAAIEFAIADRRTLIVVTADHETGGLTVSGGSLSGAELKIHFSSRGHTATPVPVYAFGPGAEQFSGVYDNTSIAKKIALLLGIKDFAYTK